PFVYVHEPLPSSYHMRPAIAIGNSNVTVGKELYFGPRGGNGNGQLCIARARSLAGHFAARREFFPLRGLGGRARPHGGASTSGRTGNTGFLLCRRLRHWRATTYRWW